MSKRKDPKAKAVSTSSRKGISKAKKKAAPKKKPSVRSQEKAKPVPIPTDQELLTDKAFETDKIKEDFRRFMASDAYPHIQHHKKRASLWALQKTFGLVKPASEMVRFDRGSYYNWRNEDPDYYHATEQLQEDLLDLAQSKLTERVNGVKVAKGDAVYDLPPDVTAILAVLNNLGKKRGFNAPVKVEHYTGQVILPKSFSSEDEE